MDAMGYLGIVLLVLGVGLYFWTRQRRGQRKSPGGVQEDAMSASRAGSRHIEGLVTIFAAVFAIAGVILLVMALFVKPGPA